MDFDLSDEELTALGRVIVKSAEFEETLDWATATMMEVDVESEVYVAIASGKTLGPKVALFDKVAGVKMNTDAKKLLLKEFMKDLNTAVEHRNIVVHGAWSRGGEGKSLWAQLNPANQALPLAATSKKGKKKFYAKDLSDLAATFERLDNNIRALYFESIRKVRKNKKRKKRKKS
jgi:hypothetical protein